MAKQKGKRQNTELMRIIKQLQRNKMAMLGLGVFLLEVLLAILAPLIAPYDPNIMDVTAMAVGPSTVHWFGTDDLGRDIFRQIVNGARYSISMGFIAIAISQTIGMTVGAIAGYFGGVTDSIIMRVLDVIQSLPDMLLSIVLSAVLGPGYFNTILALSVNGIPGSARMLRANMMKQIDSEYIEAAQSINCSKIRIIVSHLIPNSWSANIVQATMGIAGRITAAAALSFIGLGVQPPTPEWGAMLSNARQFIQRSPHMVVFPGLAIAVTVLALNLFGDGLRDAVDPKLKN